MNFRNALGNLSARPSLAALIFFVVGLLPAFADGGKVAPKDQPTKFKITTKRDTDTVEVREDKEKTVFIVKSPFGIGQAAIERTNEKWPDSVVLRLHLKGLESFRATNGKVRLEASASLQDGKPLVRVWQDGKKDAPPKSPFWMMIRMIGDDGKPAKAIPLKDGYFEMTLPRAFFAGNPKAITVNWIDFYR